MNIPPMGLGLKPEKSKKRSSGPTDSQQPPRKIGRTDPKPLDMADLDKLLKKRRSLATLSSKWLPC